MGLPSTLEGAELVRLRKGAVEPVSSTERAFRLPLEAGGACEVEVVVRIRQSPLLGGQYYRAAGDDEVLRLFRLVGELAEERGPARDADDLHWLERWERGREES